MTVTGQREQLPCHEKIFKAMGIDLLCQVLVREIKLIAPSMQRAKSVN
jgi:hypothetical protein